MKRTYLNSVDQRVLLCVLALCNGAVESSRCAWSPVRREPLPRRWLSGGRALSAAGRRHLLSSRERMCHHAMTDTVSEGLPHFYPKSFTGQIRRTGLYFKRRTKRHVKLLLAVKTVKVLLRCKLIGGFNFFS